jgi:hypothetical protein
MSSSMEAKQNINAVKKLLLRENFKIFVVINGGKPNINVFNILYYFEKNSKSMSSSVEAKSTINVVNNVYFFDKSSKSISSSMKAKPNMKGQYFFLFRKKFKISVNIFLFKRKVQNQCRHQWRKNLILM